jgi:hypothetical protein
VRAVTCSEKGMFHGAVWNFFDFHRADWCEQTWGHFPRGNCETLEKKVP